MADDFDNNQQPDPGQQQLSESDNSEAEAIELPQVKSETDTTGPGFNRHQKYLKDLAAAGFNSQQIEAAWQRYYSRLSPDQKRLVWQSVKSRQNQTSPQIPTRINFTDPNQPPALLQKIWFKAQQSLARLRQGRLAWQSPTRLGGDSRQKLIYNLKTLLVAVISASLVYGLFQLAFFNERYLQPFIKPGAVVAEAAVIITPQTAAVDPEPRLYIPKLALELRVDYDVPTRKANESSARQEERYQAALRNSVVQYPYSADPGQGGTVVIFGHSSGNLLTGGNRNYKFAFNQLRTLDDNDLVVLNYQSRQYVYKIYQKIVVWPHQVEVLGQAPKNNSLTLITCTPPGRNNQRLVVYAEQISPTPDPNARPSQHQANPGVDTIPSNSPSLLDSWFNDNY